jgi:hypothetical protein
MSRGLEELATEGPRLAATDAPQRREIANNSHRRKSLAFCRRLRGLRRFIDFCLR